MISKILLSFEIPGTIFYDKYLLNTCKVLFQTHCSSDEPCEAETHSPHLQVWRPKVEAEGDLPGALSFRAHVHLLLYTGSLYISQNLAHSWHLRECWNVIIMIITMLKKKTSEMQIGLRPIWAHLPILANQGQRAIREI